MSINLAFKKGKGIPPQAFMEGMKANQKAFREWYDAFQWATENDEAFFKALNGGAFHCFVLAADWCGDVVRNVPVVFRVLEAADIPTDVLIMEKHLDVMDEFLTMGGRAIPKVIFTTPDGGVLTEWGPRPRHVQEAMIAFKQLRLEPGSTEYDRKREETYAEMHRRYGKGTDYQNQIVQELKNLLV
jgi:hypothetical protein